MRQKRHISSLSGDSKWRVPRTDLFTDEDRDREIEHHLNEAHVHVRAAQELLYGVRRQYRGFWYQQLLGKAQNALIRLINKENKRKRKV